MTETGPSADAVQTALGEILSWREMARSGQLAKFLAYIVGAKLAGQDDAIKAYAIAVDVFGRPASFDPQADPIVRVQARRLRALLEQYYAEGGGAASPVRIRLPVGRYVPEFELVEPADAAAAPVAEPVAVMPLLAAPPEILARPVEQGRVLGLLFFGLVVAAMAALWWSWFPPGAPSGNIVAPPSVTIYEFRDLTGEAVPQPMVAGLALELVTDLQAFEDIDVTYGEQPAPQPDAMANNDPQQFYLTGSARINGQTVEYNLSLTGADPALTLWDGLVRVPLEQAAAPPNLDSVSGKFAMILGSPRGPLHAAARRRAEGEATSGAQATPYLCRVLFEFYRDTALPRDALAAQSCFNRLSDADKHLAQPMAASAVLMADATLRDAAGSWTNPEILLAAQAMAERASVLLPTSGFVWEQVARIREQRGAFAEARAAYLSALQLNPANADALAAFAGMLAMGATWATGSDMAITALTQSPDPPSWYYRAPALNALRNGDYNLCISYAESLAPADRELGPVIAVVAAIETGNLDVINRHLPEVLAYPTLRAGGILTRLRQRITDAALLETIERGLSRAGVPVTALTLGF